MHRKIYFNNKTLLLSTERSIQNNSPTEADVLITEDVSQKNIQKTIELLERDSFKTAVVIHQNLEELYQKVLQEFTLIKAAGGLVYTPEFKVLMIFRRGKWDLPKGKLDEGEDLQTCAIREVAEETGISNVQLHQLLTVTCHTYYEKGRHILKESYWYLMSTEKAQLLQPQTEEDIELCEWASQETVDTYLQNSLPSIVDVVKAAREVWDKKG